LTGETVKAKTYFYVLRPLLGCRWIKAGLGPVPMEFSILVDKMISSQTLKKEILSLIERKRSGQELDSEQKISSINDFIENEFEHLKNQTNLQPSLPNEDDKLDELFREALIEVGK
jgi:predicted nucleotidyltransferase